MADKEYVRFTIKSVKDSKTNTYPVKDYDKDIRAIENAIRSALPAEAFMYGEPKQVDLEKSIGKLSKRLYVDKDFASLAEKAVQQVLGGLNFRGGSQHKYSATKAMRLGSQLNREIYDIETFPERERQRKEEEAERKRVEKEEERSRKKAEREEKQAKRQEEIAKRKEARELAKEAKLKLKEAEQERRDREDKEKEEQNEKERIYRMLSSTVLKLIGVGLTVADITRRILTAVLSISSQQLRDTVTAHNIGLTREELRNYRRVENIHGMQEGTFEGAISGEQQKYGNITSLDEESLKYIAILMKDKVSDMATMGIGASNPEAIVEAIVNKANEVANRGYNEIGQYVGEQNARRQLYSYLLKYSPQIADIFATMQEEQHNINSIFRDKLDTYQDFKNSAGIQRGTTQAGEGVLVTLGQEWNTFKQTLDDIKHALAVTLADPILQILHRLNNLRIGMSETERLRLNTLNRNANAQALKDTEASMAILEQKAGGNLNNLTASERAYYNVLSNYAKALREENDKKEIDDITRTDNQLKLEQEQWIRAEKQKAIDLIGEANLDLSTTDPRYAQYYNFTDEEIMTLIKSQGTGAYGLKGLSSFQSKYIANRMKEIKNSKPYLSEDAVRKMAEHDSIQAFARENYRFFYPSLLRLQADRMVEASYNDQIYDIMAVEKKWGAHFENLPDALPDRALAKSHKIFSYDVKEGNVTIHKVVLDINDNGIDEGDFELGSWWGNDRGGVNGSQMELSYDKKEGVKVNYTNTQANGASTY